MLRRENPRPETAGGGQSPEAAVATPGLVKDRHPRRARPKIVVRLAMSTLFLRSGEKTARSLCGGLPCLRKLVSLARTDGTPAAASTKTVGLPREARPEQPPPAGPPACCGWSCGLPPFRSARHPARVPAPAAGTPETADAPRALPARFRLRRREEPRRHPRLPPGEGGPALETTTHAPPPAHPLAQERDRAAPPADRLLPRAERDAVGVAVRQEPRDAGERRRRWKPAGGLRAGRAERQREADRLHGAHRSRRSLGGGDAGRRQGRGRPGDAPRPLDGPLPLRVDGRPERAVLDRRQAAR